MEKEKIRKSAGILTGLTVLSISLAEMFLSARDHLYLRTVVMSAIAWSSYLAIHYIENGRLVDPSEPGNESTSSERNYYMIAVSVFLFCSGMASGSIGVAEENLLLAFLGAFSVISGYFVAHYEFTDLLV